MKLSTRSRYGIRAMFELAKNFNGKPVTINMISHNQNISRKYLHSLLTVLKTSGLVHSIWGSKGGFIITRQPSEITLHEIVTALEGPISVVDCVSDKSNCGREGDCAAREVWGDVNKAIENVLYGITLYDLLRKAGKETDNFSSMPDYFI